MLHHRQHQQVTVQRACHSKWTCSIIVSISKSQYMACHSKSTIGNDRHIPSLQQVPVRWHIIVSYYPFSLLTSFHTTLASQSASHSTPAFHSKCTYSIIFSKNSNFRISCIMPFTTSNLSRNMHIFMSKDKSIPLFPLA